MAGKIRVSGSAQVPSVPLNISPMAWLRQTEGGKQEANGGKLAFIRAVQAFTCHGNSLTSPAFQFNSIDFHVTHRFFVSFLVRPALLPCGKRGFRAAIYKIARPQPPAAAL